jgi:hypothetical protein
MMKSLRHFAVLGLALLIPVALVGCRHDRHPSVPPSAMMLAEGDQQLSGRADYDGTVYVVDTRRDRIVYSGKIEEGQTITIDPRSDEVRIDDRVVGERLINRGNSHRIFFDRGEKVERVVERRTRIEERRSRD